MTKMIDTEGEPIPERDGNPLFNLRLFPDGKMTMQVPAFSTSTGKYTARLGVLEVDLRDVFEELLTTKGHSAIRDEPFVVVELLREYAMKFQDLAALIASTAPAPSCSAEDVLNLQMAVWSLNVGPSSSTRGKDGY